MKINKGPYKRTVSFLGPGVYGKSQVWGGGPWSPTARTGHDTQLAVSAQTTLISCTDLGCVGYYGLSHLWVSDSGKEVGFPIPQTWL